MSVKKKYPVQIHIITIYLGTTYFSFVTLLMEEITKVKGYFP